MNITSDIKEAGSTSTQRKSPSRHAASFSQEENQSVLFAPVGLGGAFQVFMGV